MVAFQAASKLAATWLSQLGELRSFLDRDPLSSLAWHWRIRSKILSFLISRYGGDPHLGLHEEQDAALFSSHSFGLQQRDAKLLISGSVIRMRLARVAEGNKYKVAR